MSSAASKAKNEEGEAPEIESQTDQHETTIQYDPTSRMPLPVALVWMCALVGLGVYAVTWYMPDLQLWVSP